MIAPLLTLCSALLPAPQGQGPVAELLPLQQILTPAPSQVMPPWRTLLRAPASGAQPDLLQAAGGGDGLPLDAVLDLLNELHQAAVAGNSLQFFATEGGPGVFAAGSEAEVAKVRDRVRAVNAVMARSVQIEFAVWDAVDRETPPALLGPADYVRFTQNRQPLWRAVATTRHNQTVALERMRWTGYVRGVGTNVAQKQTALSPSVDRYGEGAHAVVRPFALTGSDEWALHVQFAVAQRRGVVRTLTMSLPASAEIDLPTLETCFGACSGRIANGGALAVSLRGHPATGGHHILTFRLSARTAPAPSTHDGLAVLPCGALTSSGLGDVPSPDDGDGGLTRPLDHGHVAAEALGNLLRGGLGNDAEACSLQVGGGWLFARGPAPALARIEAMLKGVQDRLVRTATVQHLGTLETPEHPPAGWSAMLHEFVLPTLHGRAVFAARCLETNVVVTQNISLAQEAATLEPTIEELQSGGAVCVRLSPSDDVMALQLRALHRFAPPPTARSVATGAALLMPTDVAKAGCQHDGSVTNGQAIEHGDGPTVTLEGRSHRTALSTTVRW